MHFQRREWGGASLWALDDVETLSVKDGRLYSQSGKDQDEYLSLGAETFFIRSDLGSMTFSRDAQGHIIGYTYAGPDGRIVHAKKVK